MRADYFIRFLLGWRRDFTRDIDLGTLRAHNVIPGIFGTTKEPTHRMFYDNTACFHAESCGEVNALDYLEHMHDPKFVVALNERPGRGG